LLDDKVDMLIAAANFDDPNLDWEELYATEVCFCVRDDNPLARLPRIAAAEAVKHPLVLLGNHFHTSRLLQKRLKAIDVAPNIKLRTNNLHTVKNLVRHANLGTFLLRDAVALDRDIVPIPLEKPLTTTVGMATPKRRHVYRDARTLINFIQQEREARLKIRTGVIATPERMESTDV
jgi:DNA-binding transcriptional LysR family regulator